MAVLYPSPEAVPPEAIDALKAAYLEAAEGNETTALEMAIAEILYLLPAVSNGMLRMGTAPDDPEEK